LEARARDNGGPAYRQALGDGPLPVPITPARGTTVTDTEMQSRPTSESFGEQSSNVTYHPPPTTTGNTAASSSGTTSSDQFGAVVVQ
jgi:hypothetical protein